MPWWLTIISAKNHKRKIMPALPPPIRSFLVTLPSGNSNKILPSGEITSTRLTLSFVTILILLLSGCSNPVKEPQQISAPGVLDQPSAALYPEQPQYIIQKGDELEIKFYYSAHLNDKVKVRPDGRISLQLVHDVHAATLTTNELTEVLTNKYSPTLNDPEISVIVRSFATQKVFIDGEVTAPGMVNIDGYTTILQAIASAGGLKSSGQSDEVLLIRRNGLQKPFVMTINVEDAQNGVDITQNIKVEPLDIIFIPKSAIANVNTWMELYIANNVSFLNFGFYKTIP